MELNAVHFRPGLVAGTFVIEPERRCDARGFFARVWCSEEFARQGLVADIAQINTAVSSAQGTLRGLHYQIAPHDEVKVVRCTRGAVFDVAVDLRKESPTLGRWVGVELTADNGRMLYVPRGCAHGYLTLADDTELTYLTSDRYEPTAAKGVRYDDPAFGVAWPASIKVISEADLSWPAFA